MLSSQAPLHRRLFTLRRLFSPPTPSTLELTLTAPCVPSLTTPPFALYRAAVVRSRGAQELKLALKKLTQRTAATRAQAKKLQERAATRRERAEQTRHVLALTRLTERTCAEFEAALPSDTRSKQTLKREGKSSDAASAAAGSTTSDTNTSSQSFAVQLGMIFVRYDAPTRSPTPHPPWGLGRLLMVRWPSRPYRECCCARPVGHRLP